MKNNIIYTAYRKILYFISKYIPGKIGENAFEKLKSLNSYDEIKSLLSSPIKERRISSLRYLLENKVFENEELLKEIENSKYSSQLIREFVEIRTSMLEEGIKNTKRVVDGLFKESEEEESNQIRRFLKKLYQGTLSEFDDLRIKEKEFKAKKEQRKSPLRKEKEKR